MEKNLLDGLIEILKTELKDRGIDEYEVYYRTQESVATETLDKQISSFSSGNSGGMCLRVIKDGKTGYASTELLSSDEMADLADRAIEGALATEKTESVGIYKGGEEYEPNRVASAYSADPAELKKMALEIAKSAYAFSDMVTKGTSSAAESFSFNIRLVNSSGLDLSSTCGVTALMSAPVINDGAESQSAYSLGSLTVENKDTVISELVQKAVGEAQGKLGATSVSTGRYNLVIDSKQMRSVLAVFSSAFSAKAALDGMSKLSGHVGEKIASDIVNITDDPQRAGSSVGIHFDAEGVPTHRKSVVKDGVLTTLLHNRQTAMKMGVETTANAQKASYATVVGIRPYSMAIEPGDKSLEELFELAGDGIYITELKGLHAGANAVTGDFSLESAGFMIRQGKKCEPVRSFTVAGNFFDLLKNIRAVGDTLDLGVPSGLTSFGACSVLVPDMSVAGK